MKTKFKGIVSGDHESFCWDVDIDTFKRIHTSIIRKRIKTWQSQEYYEHEGFGELLANQIKNSKSCFNDGMYRIYPNDIIRVDGVAEFTITTNKLNDK